MAKDRFEEVFIVEKTTVMSQLLRKPFLVLSIRFQLVLIKETR